MMNCIAWQQILFDKLEDQHHHKSKCQEQEQIQSLAKLFAQDMIERRQFFRCTQTTK